MPLLKCCPELLEAGLSSLARPSLAVVSEDDTTMLPGPVAPVGDRTSKSTTTLLQVQSGTGL